MNKVQSGSQAGEIFHEEMSEKPSSSVSGSKDVGANITSNVTEADFTEAERRRFIRRIDMIMMPLMFISYGLQYMDKALLSNAAQFGIIQDLDLYQVSRVDGKSVVDSSRYSYVTLIFYWGYFAGCEFSSLIGALP